MFTGTQKQFDIRKSVERVWNKITQEDGRNIDKPGKGDIKPVGTEMVRLDVHDSVGCGP